MKHKQNQQQFLRSGFAKSVLIGSLISMSFMGCASGVRQLAATPHSDWGQESEPDSLWIKADSLWAFRENAKQANEALITYASAIEQQPLPVLMTQYARACFYMGMYIDSDPVKADMHFRNGAASAREALNDHPGYAQVMAETKDENEAVEMVSGPFLESVFWSAANTGRALMTRDPYVRKAAESRFKAMVKQLLENDEHLFYSGPHRLAAMVSLRTPGGNTQDNFQEAKKHFQLGLKQNPNFVGSYTLYAEYYAAPAGDKALFVKLLEAAQQVSDDALPEVAAENRFEKKRALALLQKMETFFPMKSTAVNE